MQRKLVERARTNRHTHRNTASLIANSPLNHSSDCDTLTGSNLNKDDCGRNWVTVKFPHECPQIIDLIMFNGNSYVHQVLYGHWNQNTFDILILCAFVHVCMSDLRIDYRRKIISCFLDLLLTLLSLALSHVPDRITYCLPQNQDFWL